ncbi:MAG: ABC transporter permease [Gemmatimonas sp.]
MTANVVRPYAAGFITRFVLMLQYRAAAIAGFATQCWWGGIKVMMYAAFYRSSPAAADAPMSLADVITYTWMAQGLLALTPWSCDPEIAAAVRSGGIAYDRLRPVDTYSLWYARAAGYMTSRALPRALLMVLLAGVAFPILGLDNWSLRPPPDVAAAALFVVSLALVVLLSSAIIMLLNIAVAATLNDRGVNSLFGLFSIVLSGNLIPLPLLPDAAQAILFVQPFAGIVDIPFRIYTGHLAGNTAFIGIALQATWTIVLVLLGRIALARVFQRVEIQGG